MTPERAQELPETLRAMIHGADRFDAPAGAIPDVLLSYQKRALEAVFAFAVVVIEKSRRIGITWALGAVAVLTAVASRAARGMDVYYIGYEKDMTREFIDTCAMWARAIALAVEVRDEVFKDVDADGNERSIQAFRIRFASGFDIVALCSRPRGLRGKQGLVIADEAAFHDDLPELLKAAYAFLIWGGKVVVLSTHDGDANPFNELVNEVRAGRKPGAKLLRFTFEEALAEGLYKRICLVAGRAWSAEGEKKWAAEIRALYAPNDKEELDVIPSQGSGVAMTGALIDACMSAEYEVVSYACPPGWELRPEAERNSHAAAWMEDYLAPLLARLDPALRSHFGMDFARSRDLSVIAVGQVERGLALRVPLGVEMRNVPFAQQQQILFHIVERLPRFAAGKMDAGGNGAETAERAVQKFGAARIEGVKLSVEWYREHMTAFKQRFEDRAIVLPKVDDWLGDLRALKLVDGVIRVPDERTVDKDKNRRHGDAAIALALLHAASKTDVVEFDYTPAPPAFRRRVDEGADDARFGMRAPDDDATGRPRGDRVDW